MVFIADMGRHARRGNKRQDVFLEWVEENEEAQTKAEASLRSRCKAVSGALLGGCMNVSISSVLGCKDERGSGDHM